MRNRSTTPLSKAKLRQSWSKYNLYNLSRITPPAYKTKTFFQQKWSAKSMLRAYHSEQVRERQWERTFSRKLRSVVPMNPEYLARNNGSMESAGRGSGLEQERPPQRPPAIPYMQMTFAPLERRLDTAIFRALFASSARQARQFVVHGAVRVNGKKMIYPGYLLNPGDMFQVEPERVLFATGMPKPTTVVTEESAEDDAESPEDAVEAAADEIEDGQNGRGTTTTAEAEDSAAEEEDPRQILKNLIAQSKSNLASPREKLAAKRKQDLRAFQKSVKRTLSKSKSTTILTDSLEAQFLELQNQLAIARTDPSLPSDQNSIVAGQVRESSVNSARIEEAEPFDDLDKDRVIEAERNSQTARRTATSQLSPDTIDTTGLSDQDIRDLKAALELLHDNPIDPSKPYLTPWQPREYMSAFAFIPRYLEVNQNICAAVYLRHPVARPGLAEVPTPFGEGTNASAFAWYLRRR